MIIWTCWITTCNTMPWLLGHLLGKLQQPVRIIGTFCISAGSGMYHKTSNIRRTLAKKKKKKTHLSRQLNCWSLRCSWSIACRRCSNYILILDLTHGFNGLGKDNLKTRREKHWGLGDLAGYLLEVRRQCLLGRCGWKHEATFNNYVIIQSW